MNALAVSIGAALGALARWQAGVLFNTRWVGFPLGTLLVNLVGGFMIGMALEWFGRQPNELMKLLLVTGFLGGLTTFSAFSGESLALLKHGELGMALRVEAMTSMLRKKPRVAVVWMKLVKNPRR